MVSFNPSSVPSPRTPFSFPLIVTSTSTSFNVYPVSLASTKASIPAPYREYCFMISLWRRSATFISLLVTSFKNVHFPSGFGTAARNFPSRVLRIAFVPRSNISSLKSSWSIDNPARENSFSSLRCSSSPSNPRTFASVAEYAISIEIACPCRSGTFGASCRY